MLCTHSELYFYKRIRDEKSRYVTKCENCGHIQVFPLPTFREDENFYAINSASRQMVPESLLDNYQLMMKFEPLAQKQVEHVEKNFDLSKSILEIGSGHGWFVEKMKKKVIL